MDKQKILIIKTGYTEVLDGLQDSRITSLGDVLRTTSLLHKLDNSHITWVTSDQALPLLKGNPKINRLMHFDFITALQLQSEEFDKVINLEKVPGICALIDKVRARKSRYGFTFNTQTGEAEVLDKGYEVLSISFNSFHKRVNVKNFQELLFEMLGEKFNGEECILGYSPKTKEEYDIGFNTKVGNKWPSKTWPMQRWDELEDLVKKEYSVTRQEKQKDEVLNNLNSYIDWVNSCRMLVTNDSLGLHLALALKKKVIALYGPTSSREIYLYGRGRAITPDPAQDFEFDCIPCFDASCKIYGNASSCMDFITADKVYNVIKDVFAENRITMSRI